MKTKIFIAAAIFFAGSGGAAIAGGPAAPWECPEELRGAAAKHREEMQAREYAVRDSRRENPLRVEPTQIFDLVSHECHSGRAQMWRVFGEPGCFLSEQPGLYRVQYPYVLFFRRAVEEEKLFKEEWKEGSDGSWQVTFEKIDSGWNAVGQREVLDLSRPPPHAK